MSSPRPPLVIWLVLAICTSITICALGATPMFTDCSNINSNFTNPSSGDFEAIGCSYPSKETNVFLGFGAGTTATVYIAYGRVAAGTSASLWVQCLAAATSQSLSITVTGIAFGQDASFRFTGALPAHSSLHISNNTFYLTQRNRDTFVDPSNSGIYYTAAILIGTWGTALLLEEGTDMSAVNNTVSYHWAAGSTDQVVAIAVIGASATLKSMSALSMSGNGIINSSFSGYGYSYVAFLYLSSSSSGSSLTLYNQSAIAMNGNGIINSSYSDSGSSFVAYLYLYSTSSSCSNSLTLYNKSAIAMSGNGIINSSYSDSGSSIVARLYLYSTSTSSSCSNSLALYNLSAIHMRGNGIINSSYSGSSSSYSHVAFLYLYSYSGSSSLTLYNQSAIAMSGNSIINSSSSSSSYSFVVLLQIDSLSGSSLTLYNQSAIAMCGNSIINSSFSGSTSTKVAYLQLYSPSGSISLSMYNQSAIAMSGNSVINSSFSRYAYVAFLLLDSSSFMSSSSSISLSLYNQSAISMNSNSIINCSFSGFGSSYVAFLDLSSFSPFSNSSSSNLTLYNQSAIAMSGNSIIDSSYSGSSSSDVAFLRLFSSSGSLILANQSAIAMSGNSHSQVRASLVAIEVFGHISLTGMASITMELNNVYVRDSLVAVLRISAFYISLDDSSIISATGNILHGPALGQDAQLARLLTISSSSDNGTSSVLTISGGSSMAVSLNDIIGGAMALNVTMKVSAEFPSTIAIVDNHISEGYASWLAEFSGGFHLNGTFLATGNRVEARNSMANFSLATIASGFTNGSMASVQACGNTLSWVGPIRDLTLYVQPTSFAALVAKCLTPTLTLLASQSVSASVSPSTKMPMSYSSSHDPLASNSTLVSGSLPPTTTEQQSLSVTVEPSISLANCSIGDICQVVKVARDQLALFDTCTEHGPTETVAKDSAFVPLAKYIGNAAKQAEIHSTYNGPALPSFSLLYYGSVVVLWPEGMANVTQVAAASPSIAACWVHARSANATEIRVAVQALAVASDTALDSASTPVVLMDLTLNVSCGAASVVFNRTIAMERPVVYLPKKAFVPGKAVQDTATTSGALSVTVGAVAVPIAAMQQGVALALMRMAQCEEDALNGEPLDLSVHPLQFGLGGGSGKYGRGALVGNLLVVPAIWCVLMYLLVPLAIRALTDRTLDASRDFVGWPGMALMPLAVLSEGSAMASVGLLTQGSVGDIIMGLFGLAILLVATACWAAELWRMRRQVALRRASGVESWAKVLHPRFEWEDGKNKHDGNAVAVTSYLDKRIQLVGNSWWLWSALAAHVLSMVVGIAEGLPVSSGMCRVRWAVASLAAVLQAAAVMTNTVPVELLLLGAVGAMSCILVVLIALSTFDVGAPGSTFSALNAVGMVNSITGIALIGIGACAEAYEYFNQRSRGPTSPLSLLSVPMIPQRQASPPPVVTSPPSSEELDELATVVAQTNTQVPATPLSLLSVPMLPQQQASPPPVVTSPPSSEEELAIEVPAHRRSSRYPDMPAQWASILEDADRAASEREF